MKAPRPRVFSFQSLAFQEASNQRKKERKKEANDTATS